MSFLSGSDLSEKLKNILGDDFTKENIDNAAYELTLDSQYFVSDSEVKQPEFLDQDKKVVNINPGQFALLLTQEKIVMPRKNIGFISIKAKEKFKGLVNVSGFHVDPGFEGKLLFSVYNAGASTIKLKKGEKYFKLWVSELTKELKEDDSYNQTKNHHQNQSEIPLGYVEFLAAGDIASPGSLLNRIKSNESLFKRLEWFAGILITIGITLSFRAWYNSSQFDEGYFIGKRQTAAEQFVKNKMLDINVDSLIQTKIDSIELSAQKAIDRNIKEISFEMRQDFGFKLDSVINANNLKLSLDSANTQ